MICQWVRPPALRTDGKHPSLPPLLQNYAADVAELGAKTAVDQQYLRMGVLARHLPELLTAYDARCAAHQGVGFRF